jgi:hypothetical protein
MARNAVVGGVLLGRGLRGDVAMTSHKPAKLAVIARQMRAYKTGDKVRIIRGQYAGQVMTVRTATNDYVALIESPRRDVMSKQNVEPEGGFTSEEMIQAERVSRKGVS